MDFQSTSRLTHYNVYCIQMYALSRLEALSLAFCFQTQVGKKPTNFHAFLSY